MIKRMLDTNICIYIAKNHPPEVIHHLEKYRRGEIAVSAITWGEFSCGVAKSGKNAVDALLELLDVVPFCQKAAETYAVLTAKHPNRKANLDRLIAAHAMTQGVHLVSNNTTDFAMYEKDGLLLENWCD